MPKLYKLFKIVQFWGPPCTY